jgi:hypothetical protein
MCLWTFALANVFHRPCLSIKYKLYGTSERANLRPRFYYTGTKTSYCNNLTVSPMRGHNFADPKPEFSVCKSTSMNWNKCNNYRKRKWRRDWPRSRATMRGTSASSSGDLIGTTRAHHLRSPNKLVCEQD